MSLCRDSEINGMQRSLLLFENSCKSSATLDNYRFSLGKFLKFTKIKDHDSLASLNSDFLQELLENYLFSLKKKDLKRKSIESYFCAIECFLEANKLPFHKKSLHRMFPADSKHGSDKPYTTADIQKMLSATTSKRNKALILFFSSIGGRPGSLTDPILTFGHLHPMPLGCKAVLIYEDSTEEYWAFLTPETAAALEEYRDERIQKGEKITSNSPLFRNEIGKKVKPANYNGIVSIMRVIQNRAGIEKIKKGKRYDKAIFYGFRKRFNTILKLNNKVNSNITEILMAHHRGLDGAYLKPTREECFTEFAKAIPDLIVNESERLQEKLRHQKESKQKDDYDKEIRIFKLERSLEDVYKLLTQIRRES